MVEHLIAGFLFSHTYIHNQSLTTFKEDTTLQPKPVAVNNKLYNVNATLYIQDSLVTLYKFINYDIISVTTYYNIRV